MGRQRELGRTAGNCACAARSGLEKERGSGVLRKRRGEEAAFCRDGAAPGPSAMGGRRSGPETRRVRGGCLSSPAPFFPVPTPSLALSAPPALTGFPTASRESPSQELRYLVVRSQVWGLASLLFLRPTSFFAPGGGLLQLLVTVRHLPDSASTRKWRPPPSRCTEGSQRCRVGT